MRGSRAATISWIYLTVMILRMTSGIPERKDEYGNGFISVMGSFFTNGLCK